MKYQNLFTPVKIGSVTIKNRLPWRPWDRWVWRTLRAALTRGASTTTRRGEGGTGLIITGVTFSDCKVETQSMPTAPIPPTIRCILSAPAGR